MISFIQFEKLMIAAQTSEGKKARKLVLKLKRILQEYIVAEHEAARASEAARADALQQQLDGLRAQQQHLYVFRPFGNRFKIGTAKDVNRRIRQHHTPFPSGHLVYSVPISCKAMEKLFENIMKQHGAWIKMEEYELSLSDSKFRALFDCFARMEELLNSTPLDQCTPPFAASLIKACVLVRLHPLSSQLHPRDPTHAPEEDDTADIDIIALFEKFYIARGTKDEHFKLKQAEAKWPQFVRDVEAIAAGSFTTELIKPDKEELRQLLQSRLLAPCPKESRLIAGCTQKSAFPGWKLLDHARPLH